MESNFNINENAVLVSVKFNNPEPPKTFIFDSFETFNAWRQSQQETIMQFTCGVCSAISLVESDSAD